MKVPMHGLTAADSSVAPVGSLFEPLRKDSRFQKLVPPCSRLQRAKEVSGQRSALSWRIAVRDEDAASLWSLASFPVAIPCLEKRIEKTCRLRARNAPAQLSRSNRHIRRKRSPYRSAKRSQARRKFSSQTSSVGS